MGIYLLPPSAFVISIQFRWLRYFTGKGRFTALDTTAEVRSLQDSVIGLRVAVRWVPKHENAIPSRLSHLFQVIHPSLWFWRCPLLCDEQNIYDLSSRRYLIKLSGQDKRKLLVIESGIRFHCTKWKIDRQAAMPNHFASKLRKYLRYTLFSILWMTTGWEQLCPYLGPKSYQKLSLDTLSSRTRCVCNYWVFMLTVCLQRSIRLEGTGPFILGSGSSWIWWWKCTVQVRLSTFVLQPTVCAIDCILFLFCNVTGNMLGGDFLSVSLCEHPPTHLHPASCV